MAVWFYWLFGLLFSVDLVYPLLVISLLVDVSYIQHALTVTVTVTEFSITKGRTLPEGHELELEPSQLPVTCPQSGSIPVAQLTVAVRQVLQRLLRFNGLPRMRRGITHRAISSNPGRACI
jgi:hypothetical protein